MRASYRSILASSILLAPTAVLACCAVGPDGLPVWFNGQTNLIVWDETRGIEHFVRDARFSTKSKNLGFIAPTPSRPTLSEADARVFSLVQRLHPPLEGLRSTGTRAPANQSAPVTVVEVRNVAGYRATVLRATDSNALASWLKKNGYASPPWLAKWAAPYVRRNWYLTAFKVQTGRRRAATGPVRMSFKTDRPFNPYYVPAANTSFSPLQLYFLSTGNEVPRIGGTRAWISAAWRAKVPDSMRPQLARHLRLPVDSIPKSLKVTSYEDHSFSRPGVDDLYFVDPGKRG